MHSKRQNSNAHFSKFERQAQELTKMKFLRSRFDRRVALHQTKNSEFYPGAPSKATLTMPYCSSKPSMAGREARKSSDLPRKLSIKMHANPNFTLNLLYGKDGTTSRCLPKSYRTNCSAQVS